MIKADIDLKKEPIRLGVILNFVVTGWTVGISVIFLPFVALGILASIVSDGPFSGQTGAGILALFIVPITAFMQSLMIGCVVYFGLKFYKWFYSRKSSKN